MKIKRDAQRQKTEKEQLEKASQEISGESIPLITTINSFVNCEKNYNKKYDSCNAWTLNNIDNKRK